MIAHVSQRSGVDENPESMTSIIFILNRFVPFSNLWKCVYKVLSARTINQDQTMNERNKKNNNNKKQGWCWSINPIILSLIQTCMVYISFIFRVSCKNKRNHFRVGLYVQHLSDDYNSWTKKTNLKD